jgi:AbrB family looped-hinge helix DNA binding protein
MSTRSKIRISTKGQVVLPKALREQRGWRAGDELVVEDRPEGLLLRPFKGEKVTRYEDVAGCLGPFHRVVSIEEMNQAVVDEAARRWRRKGFARD